jgi:L-asparaginase II
MRLHVDVVIWRGDIAESRHRVQFAAADPRGVAVAGSADADLTTTYRSAAKPFQLLPLVERGHADRYGFSEEELAVMTASHTGSARHLELVRAILARVGTGPEALACGYHDPIDPESLARVRAHPEEQSPLHNNCSGKHAGMLALARAEGWPLEGYERLEHPLQQLMRRTVAELAGLGPEQVGVAVDGCSVPVFALPLSAMARAYARLAAAHPGDPREEALHRIRRAMTEHPVAVGGAGRLSTALMATTRGRLVAKGGAEGLECIGMPERSLGLAVKVEDGDARAVGPAAIAILDHLGMLESAALAALEALARPPLHNAAGRHVGRIEAVVRVLAAAS